MTEKKNEHITKSVPNHFIKNFSFEFIIEDYKYPTERITQGKKKFMPLNVWGAWLALFDIIYKQNPTYLDKLCEDYENMLWKFEEKQRGKNESPCMAPCGIKLELYVNLRKLYIEIYDRVPSTKHLKDFTEMIFEMGKSTIEPITISRNRISRHIPIRGSYIEIVKDNEKLRQTKTGDPYGFIIRINPLIIRGYKNFYTKLPNDISKRIARIKNRNSILTNAIWQCLINLWRVKQKECIEYFNKIKKGEKDIGKSPYNCVIWVSDLPINDPKRKKLVKAQLEQSFQTMVNPIGIITDGFRICEKDGNIDHIECRINSQFFFNFNSTTEPVPSSC